MHQSLETARVAAEQRGQRLSSELGSRTKETRAWRSLGRALTDIRILIFNLGRVDFRRKHLAAYAMQVQSSLSVSGSAGERAVDVSEEMFTAIGVLVEMRAVVLFLQRLCWGLALIHRDGRWRITRDKPPSISTLWLVCQTLLAHKCWRAFPGLSLRLPELLLGGSFAGVRLQIDDFVEPAVGGHGNGGSTTIRESKWDRARRCRDERFEEVLSAIDRLILWAKDERLEFLDRMVGNTSWRKKRAVVAQAAGLAGKSLPCVPEFSEFGEEVSFSNELDRSAKAARSSSSSGSSGSKDQPLAIGSESQSWATDRNADQPMKRQKGCSFVRKREPTAVGEASACMDLLGDSFCKTAVAQDAAIELESACRDLGGSNVRLSGEDLSDVLLVAASASDNDVCWRVGGGEDCFSDTSSDIDTREGETQPLAGREGNIEPLATDVRHEGKTQPLARAEITDQGGSRRCHHGSHDHELVGATRSLGWVVSKNIKTGFWQFSPYQQHRLQLRKRLQEAANPRGRFLALGALLFGSDIICKDHSVDQLRPSLVAVDDACKGRLWGVSRSDDDVLADLVHLRCYAVGQGQPLAADVLPEMAKRVTMSELSEEYCSFRSWLRTFKTLPFGHEFFKPGRVILQRVSMHSGLVVGPCFEEAISNIREASRWPPRYVPPVGTKVASKHHGTCVIQHVSLEPDMQRHYEFAMSTPLEEIRCRKIWHMVVAWHYYVHVSTSSESLAESVGSMLSFMRRANNNGKLSVKHIVWAAQLRALGLRGTGGEDGILTMALNHHFKCTGPSGWHFQPSRTKLPDSVDHKCWQQVLRDVRLAQKPQWFGTPLHDLVARRAMVLRTGVRLPPPESFVVRSEDVRKHRDLPKTEQHKRKNELGDLMWDPKHLSDVLWKKLRITATTVPLHLRRSAQPLAGSALGLSGGGREGAQSSAGSALGLSGGGSAGAALGLSGGGRGSAQPLAGSALGLSGGGRGGTQPSAGCGRGGTQPPAGSALGLSGGGRGGAQPLAGSALGLSGGGRGGTQPLADSALGLSGRGRRGGTQPSAVRPRP
jgi:hypothetical protein